MKNIIAKVSPKTSAFFLTISIYFFVCSSVIFTPHLAQSKSLPDFADYTVPTTPELVPYSRFKIKIVKPYTGPSTDTISYVFPQELTGVKDHTITLNRIAGTNQWESPEMTAACTESDDLFSCNMYLVKTEVSANASPFLKMAGVESSGVFAFGLSSPIFVKSAAANNCVGAVAAFSSPIGSSTSASTKSFVDLANVESFLKASGLTGEDFDNQMAVARAFSCSEPAGILSYEF